MQISIPSTDPSNFQSAVEEHYENLSLYHNMYQVLYQELSHQKEIVKYLQYNQPLVYLEF